jgi:hypothetical protein
LALMLGADPRKYFPLRHRPGRITGGCFARTRNSNHPGRMMIHGSHGPPAAHWAAGKARTGLRLPRFRPHAAAA